MVVANQTDSMYAGNKRTLRFTIVDEDTVGSPALNLTGRVLKFVLASVSPNGDILTTPLIEKKSTTPAQITVTDAVNGIAEVYLLEADTLPLLGDYYFELEVFEADATIHTVVGTGTLTILANVTNT